MKYYTHEKLNKSLIRIIELGGVCCYLVIGEQRACLLDTCSGYGNIKEYVATLTDKPVFVILTHGHLDHMGGASLFDEVYMNVAEKPVFEQQGNMDIRFNETRRFQATQKLTLKELIPTRTQDCLPLEDYAIFDLGRIHIKMIPVKGHTPGMMCPLIVENRSIIFGDACGVSVLIFKEFQSLSISTYRDSLLNLKQFENDYDTIYRNHGSFHSEKSLLDNVITCCEQILSHQDDRYPCNFQDYQLYAAKKFTWGHGREDGLEGNILYSLDRAI